MSEKRCYKFHIAETRHFEYEVWATDAEAAYHAGIYIWRDAPTTGQWEISDTETHYRVAPITSDERPK